jgi:hypothetical protein
MESNFAESSAFRKNSAQGAVTDALSELISVFTGTE